MPATGVVLTQTPAFHPEDTITVTQPPPTAGGRLIVPLHWTKLWGIDFGINHPFAAVLTAWDRDADVFYLLKTYKIKDAIPDIHAAAIRRIDSNAPIAWPHDGHVRDKGSGETLSKLYKDLGLRMMESHATFEDGGYSTEAAVQELDQRMKTGRLRVCEDLHDFWFEYRLYHREKGLIVKVDDDILSAVMKALMAKRAGRAGPIGYKPFIQQQVTVGSSEFDVFTGRPFDL